jgi:hypothetical protein
VKPAWFHKRGLNEQRIRAFLFYSSVAVFFAGLPLILSFSFGYKFDRRTFKFSRTGLLYLKTQPPGAEIYLDKKLLVEKSPATVNELLPGTYEVRVELRGYYPWSDDVRIEESKITRLDKILLFPLRNNLKKVNKTSVAYFFLDKDKEAVYYLDSRDRILYRCGLDGERRAPVGRLPELQSHAAGYLFSSDRNKLLYFSPSQIGIAELQQRRDAEPERVPFILDYPQSDIRDVFWHSDSFHLVIVTARCVEVMEARPRACPITLARLNRRDAQAYYDTGSDTLWFLDQERSPEGDTHGNLYKLELDSRTAPLYDLIRIKNEE